VKAFLFRFIVLMQHEQIKDEFVNQGGLEPFISFIRYGHRNKQSDKQLEGAFNILWSCVINNPEALRDVP
jgi:hypothetical protein